MEEEGEKADVLYLLEPHNGFDGVREKGEKTERLLLVVVRLGNRRQKAKTCEAPPQAFSPLVSSTNDIAFGLPSRYIAKITGAKALESQSRARAIT